jgi:hypothetical protein
VRHGLFGLVVLSLVGGCKTQEYLAQNTVRTTATLTDLNYHLVLTNVALFTRNPSAIPSFAIVNAGTVTVNDTKIINASGAVAPTISRFQQVGGTPFALLAGGPTFERDLTENWSMLPISDPDVLQRLRSAFQLLVTAPEATESEASYKRLTAVFLDIGEPVDSLVPRDWYQVGSKRDVPKEACYVGCYAGVYVWVTPEGLDGLSRFTLTVLDLASGKQHAPTKTVEKTYKADGTLESIRETTSQIDQEALERARREGTPRAPAENEPAAPGINRGLFFLPRRTSSSGGFSPDPHLRYLAPNLLLK